MSPTKAPLRAQPVTGAPVDQSGCVDDMSFHVKDCPSCTCPWFQADPARCTAFGGHQGVVRDPVTNRWHKANSACCVCVHAATPSTASPTKGPVHAVAGVHGCTDKVGNDGQAPNAAFSIKGCPDCTCGWLAKPGRCDAFAKYTGAVSDATTGKNLKPAEACCFCGGGDR